MTDPEEIVCSDPGEFVRICADRGFPGVIPGETAVLAWKRVRIVYRPPAPDRCPRCGSDDRNNYIHSVCPPRHEFHAACDFDGDYHPWHAAERIAVRFAGHRAGNVPTSFSQRQLDMEWNAAIETAAAIEGACCNTNAKKILCLRRPSP